MRWVFFWVLSSRLIIGTLYWFSNGTERVKKTINLPNRKCNNNSFQKKLKNDHLSSNYSQRAFSCTKCYITFNKRYKNKFYKKYFILNYKFKDYYFKRKIDKIKKKEIKKKEIKKKETNWVNRDKRKIGCKHLYV